jgi:hypothetical protein
MAYRFEYPKVGGTVVKELVIDGWENGIADSPYQGITSMKNVNIFYLPGSTYINYGRTLSSSTAGTGTFTASNSGTVITLTMSTPFNTGDSAVITGGSLPSGLTSGDTYYNVGTPSSPSLSLTRGGSVITFGSSGSGTLVVNTMNIPKWQVTDPISGTIYVLDSSQNVWDSSVTGPSGAIYFTLLAHPTDNTTNEMGSGVPASSGTGNGLGIIPGYITGGTTITSALVVFGSTKIDVCGRPGASVSIGGGSSNWTNDFTYYYPSSTFHINNATHMALFGQDDILYFSYY